MITIYFNDEITKIFADQSLMDFLLKQGHTDKFFSVMLNEQFVPRIFYPSVLLQENDVIELITPMQGG